MNHATQKVLLFAGGLLIGAMGAALFAQFLMEPPTTINVYVEPAELERLEVMDALIERLGETP